MCKFSAKADSIYMMKLTKTFLKTSVIFWSHLTQIFKTDEVKEEKKIIRNKQSQNRERFNRVVVHKLEASKTENNKIRDNTNKVK